MEERGPVAMKVSCQLYPECLENQRCS